MSTAPRTRCTAEGCRSLAATRHRWCITHAHRYSRQGHEEGRAITPRELQPFRDLASRILSTYGERADVQAAVKWCDLLLTSSPTKAAGRELLRLRRSGVKGEDVLHIALAVFAFSERLPGSLPDDARLTYAYGRTLVRLKRQPRSYARSSFKRYTTYIPVGVFKTLGLLLRQALAVLLSRLLKLHDRARETSADLLRTIRDGAPSDPADILFPRKQR